MRRGTGPPARIIIKVKENAPREGRSSLLRSVLFQRLDDVCRQLVQLFLRRLVGAFHGGHQRLALGALQPFVHLVGRLPAPAVGAEGDELLPVPVQPPEIGEERRHRRHHVVVEGGGADGDVFRGHGVSDDVGIVAVMQVVQAGLVSAGEEGVFDRVRHRLGGVPHGVVHDGGGVVVLVRHPRFIEREDIGDMLRPDDPVAGADRGDLQPFQRGERLARLHAVRLHDVRVILARLYIRLGQVALGVRALVGGVVLPEGVVGEEDLLGEHIRHHVVRPVHHRRGHEGQRAFSDGERFARLHAGIAEVAVVGGKVFHPRARGGIDGGVFGDALYIGERAAVVGLGMVGDNDVDLFGVDDGGDAREHFALEARLHRVDEGDLFVENEVCVVSGAFFRFIAVEVAQVPVHRAYPVDAFAYLHRFHRISPENFSFIYNKNKIRAEGRRVPPFRAALIIQRNGPRGKSFCPQTIKSGIRRDIFLPER